MTTGESPGLSTVTTHPSGGRRYYPPNRTRSANAHSARGPALLEIGLGITGTGLAIFVTMHMAFLLTILIGADTMDALGGFLEDYYLLWLGVPPLIVFFALHVVLAARKSPTTSRQQYKLIWQVRTGHHWDTFSWAVQVITGVGLLVMASIHMWVILTELPILAEKSGARVTAQYLWIDIPFIVFSGLHTTTGLYRIAVKWGIASRRVAHGFLIAWTITVLGLGFATLTAFYRLGGDV